MLFHKSITSQVHGDLAANSKCLHRDGARYWTLTDDVELLATYWQGVAVRDIKVRDGHSSQAAKDRLRKLRSVLSNNVVDGLHIKNAGTHELLIDMMRYLKENDFQEGCAAARKRLNIDVPDASDISQLDGENTCAGALRSARARDTYMTARAHVCHR